MTTSTELLALCVPKLVGTTDAGATVFSPLDLPTVDAEYPLLLVQMPTESGDSLGNVGGPQFTVNATLQVVGRVSRDADVDDIGAAQVYAALDRLKEQIKAAIIGGGLLAPLGPVQEITGFRAVKSLSDATAARHYGQVVVEIDLQFRQDLNDFCVTLEPLENIHATTKVPVGTAPVEIDTFNLNA